MIKPTQTPLIQSCLLIFVVSTPVLAGQITSHDKLISTLEYIADGYETHSRHEGPVRIRGRIFLEQRAQEGREISQRSIIPAKWANFEYIQKGGKRRYEGDSRFNPGDRYYALDNNKRLLQFAKNVVRIFPLSDEEHEWPNITGEYGDFLLVCGLKGYENVGRAMRTLIEQIRTGKFDRDDYNVSVNVDEQGSFTICVKMGINVNEWVIDSRRGFNLVKAKHYYPGKKFWSEHSTQYDYTQLKTGQWVLAKGELKGLEDGVVIEERLETTEIQTDFEAPDEIFEAESLNIPADIDTVDYHFSPPLELHRGGIPHVDYIDTLLESDIAKTQTAQVDDKGNVTVNTHQAYVEHEARNAKKPVEAPIATSAGRRYVFVLTFTLIVACGGVISVLVYLRLKRQVRQ